jgi:hypothetical protein
MMITPDHTYLETSANGFDCVCGEKKSSLEMRRGLVKIGAKVSIGSAAITDDCPSRRQAYP